MSLTANYVDIGELIPEEHRSYLQELILPQNLAGVIFELGPFGLELPYNGLSCDYKYRTAHLLYDGEGNELPTNQLSDTLYSGSPNDVVLHVAHTIEVSTGKILNTVIIDDDIATIILLVNLKKELLTGIVKSADVAALTVANIFIFSRALGIDDEDILDTCHSVLDGQWEILTNEEYANGKVVPSVNDDGNNVKNVITVDDEEEVEAADLDIRQVSIRIDESHIMVITECGFLNKFLAGAVAREKLQEDVRKPDEEENV